MLNFLVKKMLTSRKFVVLATTLLLKALTPVVGKLGIDISVVSSTLDDIMPVILTWLAGQSVVDAAKELRPPDMPVGPPPDLPPA